VVKKLKDLGLSIPKNAMPYIAFAANYFAFQCHPLNSKLNLPISGI